MQEDRWDLTDDSERGHFDLPRASSKARLDLVERAAVSVVGDQEDSMVARLVQDVKPLPRRLV